MHRVGGQGSNKDVMTRNHYVINNWFKPENGVPSEAQLTNS